MSTTTTTRTSVVLFRPRGSPISPFLKSHLTPSLHPPHTHHHHHLTSTYSTALTTTTLLRRSFHSSLSPLLSPSPSSPSKDIATSPDKAVTTTTSSEKASKPKGTLFQRGWKKVKEEATHYWHGTKLLGKEIRISARIQGRLLAGKKLTRREHRQLKRTTQDLLRLIPFSVFLIVPFMELLLPVALKLFPNMLPSTFTDKFKEDEKKRKLLKVRLEMAKFLQETIRESGIKSPDKIKESEDFKEFFRKVRSTGENPTTDEVVKVSKLFEDDLTLDNLSRPQLVSMCRYMNINAFGTDNFLRYTIRSRLKQLELDDRVIDSEGISALSLPELQAACQSRGIRTLGVSEDHLRKELEQWVDLHLRRGLSGTLLILSKAFGFNRPMMTGSAGVEKGEKDEGDDIMMSLKDTLASLPDNLLNETELEVSSDSATYKQRLEVLQQQEELIEDEKEQEMKEAEMRRLKKEKAEEEKKALEEKEKEMSEEKEKVPEKEQSVEEKKEEEKKEVEEKGKAEEMLPSGEVKEATEEAAKESTQDPADVRMTSEQVTELGQALEILSAKSSVIKERTELRKLMEEHKVAETEGAKPNPLAKRLKSILAKIDKQLEEYDNEVGGRLNMFQCVDGKISVGDLRKALEVIAHRPTDEAIAVLLEKLDVDNDSFVPLDDIVQLAEGEGLGIIVEEISELEQNAAELIQEEKTFGKEELLSKRKSIKDVKEEGAGVVGGGAPVEKEKKLKKEDVVES